MASERASDYSFDDLAREGSLTFGDGYRTKQSELGTPGFPILRVTQVADGRIAGTPTDHVRVEFAPKIGSKVSQDRDVVLTTKGTFGRRVLLRDCDQGYVYSPQLCWFRVHDANTVDARYLYYWLGGYEFMDQAAGMKSQTDMADYLSLRDLGNIRITLPSTNTQRAIAHILGTLDDKIELNRRMAHTLEEMARALFQAWFVDFEPVRAKIDGRWRPGESLPGLPAHLYDLFPDRLVDSELGPIPEGWEVGCLGDVAEHPRRRVRPSDMGADTPYIGLEHMPRGSIALSDWGNADAVASNKFEFKRGEILFGKLRPYFHKVGVAPLDGVCSTDIVVLKPHNASWFGFLLCHVSHASFVDFTSAGSTGTRMPRTSWSQMARYPLAVPPGSVAMAFQGYVQPAVDQILAGIHQARTLAGLREALLPTLISGEVRVEDPDRVLEDTQ